MKALIKEIVKKLVPNTVIRRTLTGQGSNRVTLTFDDGPHPDLTPQVLDLLDEFDTRACFFLVGKFIAKYPELLSEIRQRGHLLGNHTYEHPRHGYASFDEYCRDIGRCQQLIFDLTSQQVVHFRPPEGIISLKGLRAARSFKLRTIVWSCEGAEWGAHKSMMPERSQIAWCQLSEMVLLSFFTTTTPRLWIFSRSFYQL